MACTVARVFPRKTSYSPIGDGIFFDRPGFLVPENIVKAIVSCTFSWDKPKAEMLAAAWGQRMETELGGPAYGDRGGAFTPGMFLRDGYVLTSRGCPHKCKFCVVPKREGGIRPLEVKSGNRILDSNLFACPRKHVESVFAMLQQQHGKVGLHGGLDAKIVEDWHFGLIADLRKKLDRIYVAYDTPQVLPITRNCIRRLRKDSGLSLGQVRCFVLCGFDKKDTPLKAEKRCMEILQIGAVPFASYYRAPDDLSGRRPREWGQFVARWAWMPGVFARIKRENADIYRTIK